MQDYRVRPLEQGDFFWLKDFDSAPLPVERDSVYLLFCVHFANTSFVAVDAESGTPLGFLLGFLPAAAETAFVHHLVVAEHARGAGIGRALMRAFMDAVRGLGAKRVSLFTSRAAGFYEPLGFRRWDNVFGPEVSGYLQAAKGAVVMTADLSEA